MDYTYLDYFNYYLREFLNELLVKYPELKNNVLGNYRALLEGKDGKSDMYVKYYYSKINNHLIKIAKKDTTLFDNVGVVLIEGVDFHHIWKHSRNDEKSKIIIWKYLQLLMILGRKIIPNHREVLDMLNKVGGEVNVPAKVKEILSKEDEDEKTDVSDPLGLTSMMGLASGLLGGGGDLNMGNMMGELEKVLGNMPKPEQFESFDEDGNPKESTASGVFDDLANEMANTFDFEEMEQGEEPKNIGEAMQKFMAGDNLGKVANVVQNFGSRLQNDIASGKVKQEDLLRDTLGMMQNIQKGSGDPEAMKREAERMVARNPELKKRMDDMKQKNETRDRLKAKLEKRKQEKQEQE